MTKAQQSTPIIPHWMRGILILAATYNLVWGMLIIFFPEAYFSWLSKGLPMIETGLIKGQGMAVFIVGILLFSTGIGKPGRWPIILAVVLAKLLGGVLVYAFILGGTFTKPLLFQIIMSDIVWVPPLFVIMKHYKKTGRSW